MFSFRQLPVQQITIISLKWNHADAKDSCKNHPHTQSTSFFVMCSKCHIWGTTSLSGIIYVALVAIYIVNFNLSELIHIALWRNSAICSWFMENCFNGSSWWRHQMETFSALLALCVGNSPVTTKGQWHRKYLHLMKLSWNHTHIHSQYLSFP